MGHPIPKQHPEVVLRAHYKAVRNLLAVAIIAVIALAAAVVILANDENTNSTSQPASVAQPSTQAVQPQTLPPGTRFDGGPDEGTRGVQSYWQQSDARSSYQPTPNEGFKSRAGGPQLLPMGPDPSK